MKKKHLTWFTMFGFNSRHMILKNTFLWLLKHMALMMLLMIFSWFFRLVLLCVQFLPKSWENHIKCGACIFAWFQHKSAQSPSVRAAGQVLLPARWLWAADAAWRPAGCWRSRCPEQVWWRCQIYSLQETPPPGSSSNKPWNKSCSQSCCNFVHSPANL